ncbi:MAG: hypothetical protein AMXMBFR26_00900 [Porticoccaceae bacterium]
MNLQFHSLAELFAMGGHGVYVWAVYGVAALVMGALVVRPLRRHARALAAVRSARQRGR